MNRILLFSDSHGQIENMTKVIERIPEFDAIIHLGDYVKDTYQLEKSFPDKKIYTVKGNNDFAMKAEFEQTLEIFGKKIFITHGHHFGVKTSYEKILDKLSDDVDAVLFGHTHIPYYKLINDKILANPGSISSFHAQHPSYGILEIERNILKCVVLDF